MTVTYLTGTRYPSSALKYFLSEYLEILLHRGESLLTTNKPGVDALIVRHCDQHNLPLQVYEFACDSSDDFRNRRVKAKSEVIQVQRVVSPSWRRFRNLADRADKMIFSTWVRPEAHVTECPRSPPLNLPATSVGLKVSS
ncbi:MAG: hypothetical protein KJ064_28075 [Anaerolineae bacterium]|nr:hypothetical protein [Anaerolineae bacterium]